MMFIDEDELTLYYALLNAIKDNKLPLELKYSSMGFSELDKVCKSGEEKIVLYGSGAMCDYFLNRYDYSVKYIVDRGLKEGQQSFCGYNIVLPVNRLSNEDNETAIVITPIKAAREISEYLEQRGFKNIFILGAMEYKKDEVREGVNYLGEHKEEQQKYLRIWRRKQRKKAEINLRIESLEREIKSLQSESYRRRKTATTKCGKYSYGPLCRHYLVDEIGSFTSVAEGTDVVPNHAMGYISLHPMIYWDVSNGEGMTSYNECTECDWYFDGVTPIGKTDRKKIRIGSDVWIGRNVLITNSSNIGNGAIIGAGSVVTKDVPDYAVVVGAPARIIRYRFTKDQIDALNKIQWWDWDDEKIRENYNDFFIPVDEFISNHL